MKDKLKRLHDAQMKDVVEMQAIYEAAQGKEAVRACEEVLGEHGTYRLTAEVAEGIERRVEV